MKLKSHMILFLFALLYTLENQMLHCVINLQDDVLEVAEILPIEILEEAQLKKSKNKIYYTPQERKKLFLELGVEYLDTTFIDYEHIFKVDPKQSEIYLRAVDNNKRLTALYGANIAMCSLMPMSIRWLGLDVGYGAFAEDNLPKDGFVGIYAGAVQDRLLISNTDYAWLYPISTLEGRAISLSGAEKGNELRFINDGQDPNCVAKYILGLDNLWHICYIAIKDIKKGDQLLVSYGPAYWNARKNKYQNLAGV